MDYTHFPPNLLEFAMEHERGEYLAPQGGISASGLTIPGQIASLMQTHAHKLTPQLNVAAFIGSCIHKGLLYPLAAKYPDVSIEERLITMIDGVVFSGQYDYLAKLYDPQKQRDIYRLGDVKTTWNWAMYKRHLQTNGKEYEPQLAAYVLLLNTIGIEIEEVRVHIVYLDGNKTKERTLYPRLWEPAETLEYIKRNIWRKEALNLVRKRKLGEASAAPTGVP